MCSCPDLRSEIEDASARFTEAFNRQDAEAVSQLYTEDCALMPTGVDIINGRKSQCYNVNTCPYACTYSTLWDSYVDKYYTKMQPPDAFEIITTTTPTIPYYTINPSYCWIPDLENQECIVQEFRCHCQ